MALALQDIENAVLFNTQQSELVNFGGAPNWSASTNPALTQPAVDYAINRAYKRVFEDTADLELYTVSVTITSTAQTNVYTLPPPSSGTANPPVQRLSRLFYNPVGQPWTLEFEPGVRLVSWKEFQRYTAAGYLQPFTYNIIPDFAAVTPNRTQLQFFPGSANASDTITLQYVPVPTANTTVPLLAAETDVPLLPDECTDAIILWATSLMWPKLREMGEAAEYRKQYLDELTRIREVLGQRSGGDSMRITDREEGLVTSYPVGGALYLP